MKMIRYTSTSAVSMLFGLALALPSAVPAAPQDTAIDLEESYVTEGEQGGIPWVSGGVGKTERERLQQEAASLGYNLKLEFAVASGAYLGDVNVRIDEVGGATALQASSKGPWFLTKLPAGSYKVTVTGFNESFSETVQVPAQGMETVVFNRWTKPEVREATPGPTY